MTLRRILAPALVFAAVAAPAHAATGDIRTVAGGGTGGDGGPAVGASFAKPRRVAFMPDGGFLLVQFGTGNPGAQGRVRRVSPSGVVSTVAGDGAEAFSGDGGPATAASLNGPSDVVLTPDGGYLIADEYNMRIRKVSADGVITSVAGTGAAWEGVNCDASQVSGASPASVSLGWPRGLAVEPGGYLLVDEYCGTVQRVTSGADGVMGSPDDSMTTVATGLNRPKGVASITGGFLVADSGNNRIVRFSGTGSSVVAGNGSAGFSGDGGAATSAQLRNPRDVEAAPDGGFVIADSDNYRVRRVTPDGVIRTVAGTGTNGVTGDGGPAVSAAIAQPHGVNISPSGDLYVSGSGFDEALGNNGYRVRVVEGTFASTPGGSGGGTTTSTTTTAPPATTAPGTTTAPPSTTAPTTTTAPAGTTGPVTTTTPRTTSNTSTASSTVRTGATAATGTTPATTTPGQVPGGTGTTAGPVAAPPARARLLPKAGSVLSGRVTLRWTPRAGTTRYTVRVWRVAGRRRVAVATRVVRTPRLTLDTRRLGRPGAYRWSVAATVSGFTRPLALGTSRFVVRVTP